MSKTTIGLLFILVGITYGSLALDGIYDATLGWLVQNNWLQPPVPSQVSKNVLGRKSTIILYSLALIIIGIFILWNQ